MALDDVLRNFNSIAKEMQREAEKAVYEVAGDLMKESIKVCPMSPLGTKTSGDLRKSAKLRMIKKGNNPIAEVSYGGGQVYYAAAVHEIKRQNYSEPGTSWKYLENPLKQNEKKYLNYLRKRIGRGL